MGVQLLVFGPIDASCRATENSEVFPAASVAVAVIHSLRLVAAGSSAANLALPAASVVTLWSALNHR
jgi:hypothetical protein